FFSSRRRHTIFSRDWSSDVCSSDLMLVVSLQLLLSPQRQLVLVNRGFLLHLSRLLSLGALGELGLAGSVPGRLLARPPSSLLREIGRACVGQGSSSRGQVSGGQLRG